MMPGSEGPDDAREPDLMGREGEREAERQPDDHDEPPLTRATDEANDGRREVVPGGDGNAEEQSRLQQDRHNVRP